MLLSWRRWRKSEDVVVVCFYISYGSYVGSKSNRTSSVYAWFSWRDSVLEGEQQKRENNRHMAWDDLRLRVVSRTAGIIV